MLKSPSSILNSIQRMKTNLRNDKEQLRIIKTNFVYLDHIQPRSRPFDHETKVKNRSKSVLNSNQSIQVGLQESPHDKQNCNIKANVIQKDNNDSRITIKDQISTQRGSTVKTNRVYLSTEHPLTQQQNILQCEQKNFKKHQSSRVSHHDDKTTKQLNQLKTIKARYQKEIQKLKQQHEQQKRQLLERVMGQAREERQSYERQAKEMREYIELLQGQVRDMAESKNSSSDVVNTSCQMTLKQISIPESKCQTTQQQTQTTQLQQLVNHFINDKPSHDKHQQSNSFINGICVHQNNLIEELCIKYFGGNTGRNSGRSGNGNGHVREQQITSSRNYQQEQSFHPQQRQKYQHIINKLLQQNTKLYNKLQKIYGQAHSSQHHHNPSINPLNKPPIFKPFGINYKTVTSHGGQEEHASISERSRVINKYPMSKESGSIPGHSIESQFQSRVTELNNNNYHTHREGSVENNKNKQSIVYRISNVMSASLAKEGKSQSRSKIPMKQPPVKGKHGINVSMPQKQKRMKTQFSDKESQFYSENFNSNKIVSVFDTLGGQSREISSQQRIPTMREKLKNQPSFKFYDDDSQVSQFLINQNNKKEPSNNNHKMPAWQDQSESEIKDDQIKLKTIKNFKCLQNQ